MRELKMQARSATSGWRMLPSRNKMVEEVEHTLAFALRHLSLEKLENGQMFSIFIDTVPALLDVSPESWGAPKRLMVYCRYKTGDDGLQNIIYVSDILPESCHDADTRYPRIELDDLGRERLVIRALGVMRLWPLMSKFYGQILGSNEVIDTLDRLGIRDAFRAAVRTALEESGWRSSNKREMRGNVKVFPFTLRFPATLFKPASHDSELVDVVCEHIRYDSGPAGGPEEVHVLKIG